jgi:general secretion pathway protein B
MSYILEALADSEQARQQIAATPRYSLLPAAGEELPRRRRWPYALAGALLVNAVVLHVWLRPALPGAMASIKAPTVPQAAESPALAPQPPIAPVARSEKSAADAAAVTSRDAGPPQYQPERVDERRVARPPAPAAAVLPRTASADPVNDGAAMLRPKFAPKVIAKRSAETAIAKEANLTPSPETSAPASGSAELPTVLQLELPALSVAGFIRDEGSSSMVIVNDRLVREGDEVAPGVKLEKILNDHLVFNYKGYRFTR